MINFYDKQKYSIFISKIYFALAITLLVSCSNESKMTGKSARTMPGITDRGNPLPEQASSDDGKPVVQSDQPISLPTCSLTVSNPTLPSSGGTSTITISSPLGSVVDTKTLYRVEANNALSPLVEGNQSIYMTTAFLGTVINTKGSNTCTATVVVQPAGQPLVATPVPPACRNEEFQVSRDSVTTVRCTPNPGAEFLPLYPAVESCPAGMTNVGTIPFYRTTAPIYHVNLGPAGNFPVRGYIYSTDLNLEQLSAAEKTLSAGTYQVTFDQLLGELGVSKTVTNTRSVCN
jgi:hypothetical protein